MSFIDFDLIKKRIAVDEDFKGMYQQMETETLAFRSTFDDDPNRISRWGHHYFCKEDGSALIYNPETPKKHQCPICGTVYESDLFDGVWVYQYRNNAVLTLMKAAVLYGLTKEKKFLDIYEEILSFYVNRYTDFELHNKEGLSFDSVEEMKWGCGRLMPQGLNESIILNRILFSIELVKEEVDLELLDTFKSKFIVEVFKLLKPQVVAIHNISCWVNATIGSMGLFAENQELIDFAFKGEYNIGRQLREGVTDDHFWHEGSIHYNFFTLEGVTSLALFAKSYGYDFGPDLSVVNDMLVAAYGYAFDNHRFPNPNDGWPDVNLKTYSYIYSIGTKVFGSDSEVAAILEAITNKEGERGTVPLSKPYYYNNKLSYERFILLPDFVTENREISPQVSKSFKHSNFALLKKDDWNVFLKYGHNGPSHAHPDKMTIEVMLGEAILTKDLSNAGYGSAICNEWHRVTASHNTVVIDGQNHTSTEPGILNLFTNDQVSTRANEVFEDVSFNREITLVANGYEDEFEATSQSVRTYDYMSHVDASLLTEVEGSVADLGYDTNGYQHLTDVIELEPVDGLITLQWRLGDVELEQEIKCQDMTVYMASSPDNPITNMRKTIIVRRIGESAEFAQSWHKK